MSSQKLQLVANAVHLSPPTNEAEFATYALRRDLEYLKLELSLWQERCHFKNVLLGDEAEFLQECLETGEPVSVEGIKRQISRLRGAQHKFERAK